MRSLVRSVRLSPAEMAWLHQVADTHGLPAETDAQLIRFVLYHGLDQLTARRWRLKDPEDKYLQLVTEKAQPSQTSRANRLRRAAERFGDQLKAHREDNEPKTASSPPPEPVSTGQGRFIEERIQELINAGDWQAITQQLEFPELDPRTGRAWTTERWTQRREQQAVVAAYLRHNFWSTLTADQRALVEQAEAVAIDQPDKDG